MQFEHATTGAIIHSEPEATTQAAPEPTVPACTMLLPRNLAALAKCADKNGTARYAVSGVQLERTDYGYRASATDCKSLAIVEGPAEDTTGYPLIPALMTAPNSATTAIIGAKFWTDAFKTLPKARYKPILGKLAVVLGENISTLASTDLEQDRVSTPRNMEGRFPNVQDCIPTSKTCTAKVRIDANRLASLLGIAADFATDDGYAGVTLEFHGEKPMVIRAANAEGQKFTGVIVPLNAEDKPKRQTGKGVNPHLCDTLRTIARLSAVWYAHANAYQTCPGNARGAHRDIMQRCQKAHANLTQKYLS